MDWKRETLITILIGDEECLKSVAVERRVRVDRDTGILQIYCGFGSRPLQ